MQNQAEAPTGYPITFGAVRPEKMSRLTTFFICIMVIPHAIILGFLGFFASIVLFLSWWAILFTGKMPVVFFDFIVWYTRWTTRVTAYSSLMTDKYPPFTERIAPEEDQ